MKKSPFKFLLTSGFIWIIKKYIRVMLEVIHKIKSMNHKEKSPVSVNFSFDHTHNRVHPRWILWDGRLYPVVKVGLHHTCREGRTLYHVFSVTSKTLFFRLILNTENLHWTVSEISDGMPS